MSSPNIISPRFRLPKRLEVYVCIGDIVAYDEPRAGIVNPVVIRSAGKVDGKGKVFERLKEAGGKEYIADLNNVVPQDGCECVLTKGGQLKSLIIHPLRKVINDDTKKDAFINNMKDSLLEARQANLHKLIFPLVYSGSGGIPLEECAFFYACAIYEYGQKYSDSLQGPHQILFVEHDMEKAKSLVNLFNVLFPTLFAHHMVIPKDYDIVKVSHVYVNQALVRRERVSNTYETIEQHGQEDIDIEKGESLNAVPGRRSIQVAAVNITQDVNMFATPVYENIDSVSVCDIDVGQEQSVSDIDENRNLELNSDNTPDYDIIKDTMNEHEANMHRSISINASDYEEIKELDQPGTMMENKSAMTKEEQTITKEGQTITKEEQTITKEEQSITKEEQDISTADQSNTNQEQAKTKEPNFVLGEFTFEKTTLVIQQYDIRDAEVDVIVCPEYQRGEFEFEGFVPNGIRCAFGVEKGTIEEKIFERERVATSFCSKYKYKVTYVYHVKAAVFKFGQYPITRDSEENLRTTVEKVFDKLHRLKNRNIKTIAFPLIGSIDVSDKDLIKSLCSHFIKVIFRCCDKRCGSDKLEVQIVNHCPTITEWLQESLYKTANGDYTYW
ncbi:uncharacterized protein LOC127871087 [Dreissena polymorpha]|uniref:Macro domain-containing protein n=1 Tax=Dreissena polymorpha TaxID=45954 RepID=A0A9D4R679_DREPO|nr:uncharacterized protein LOC127871087 [Dreissena polymorpha]XP_052269710.1 uncharacterized protein LOC127871087 [Dreissena polymorpha]KAH3855763.1 hypothetical protein DPMN_098332 [Dreissena polymorpha]